MILGSYIIFVSFSPDVFFWIWQSGEATVFGISWCLASFWELRAGWCTLEPREELQDGIQQEAEMHGVAVTAADGVSQNYKIWSNSS